MTRINCDTRIHSSAAWTAWLQFTNDFDSATPAVVGWVIGVDATGNVVRVDPLAWTALLSVTDGTNTEVVSTGDTVTFAAGDGVDVAVSATDTVTYSAKLSTDAGNDLLIGTDGGLLFSANSLVTGAAWDDALNAIVITFEDGSTTNVPITDNIANFLADFTISDGTTTDLVNNHETITFSGTEGITTTVSGNTVTTGLPIGTADWDLLVWNNTTWAYEVSTQAAQIAFDITDGTTTESVADGDTVTFVGAWQALVTVSATDTVTVDVQRYSAPHVLVANTPLNINHAINTDYPQVDIYDSVTGEKIIMKVVRVDANNITVESTLAWTYIVSVQ